MRHLCKITLVVFAMAALAGCGALFNGSPQTVTFTSEPSGAEVWVDGANMGKAPIALELSKRKSYMVTFKMDGKEDRTYSVGNHVKAGIVVLDVLGGLIPAIVDAATGSWYGLDSGSLHGVLTDGQRTQLLDRTSEGAKSAQP